MKLPAYPRTKPSGVEWLGDVPEHWEVKRLKYSASINDEALPEATLPDYEFEYLDIGGVSAVDGIAATEQVVFESAPSRARRRVRHGDTIVSTVRTYLRAIAPIKNPPENLIVSTGFAVVRPRKVEPAFLAYALRESSFIESVVARSVGVSYPACNASEVGGIAIPLPAPAEQRAIAGFLDRETGRVDRLVAKKRELIERLKEKRTALISRTVTRGLPVRGTQTGLPPAAARAAGLPANPPLKPSGIDWLGDIPNHWEVTQLKYAATRIVDCPHETPVYSQDGEFAVIRTADMILGALRLENVYRVDAEEYRRRIRREPVIAGDVLYGREGERWGFAATVPASPVVCLGQRMMQFRVAAHYSSRFLMWQLNGRGVYEQGAIDTMGSTAPHVNVETIRNYWLTEPPLPEQAAIAAYLDMETAKLDALVGKVEEAVERLQEYRTALITAAVTGKIDVRHEPQTNTITP